MSSFAAWIQASRPLAQVNLALPLLFGQALAYGTTASFSWAAFAWVHAFGVFDQLFIVYANDYADADSDRHNETFGPYSGGSRVVPEGKIERTALLRASKIMAGLLIASTVGAAIFSGKTLAPIGALAAIVLLWAYSFRPIRASYRGQGETLQALGLGVVLPTLGYYLQAGTLAELPWLALIPAFLLGYAGNINTSLPDFPSDNLTQKRSYPVRVGQFGARRHCLQLLGLAALATPLAVPRLHLALTILLVVAAFALILRNGRRLGSADAQNRDECHAFVFGNAVILNLLLVSWALAAAFT